MVLNIFSAFGGVNSLILSRDPGSISGSQFIQDNINLNGSVRENNILNEIKHGNIPNFLRQLVAIDVSIGTNTLTYLVMSDYLSIGSDNDFVRMPMSPLTAQLIATQFDCSLPTRQMVKTIWKNSTQLSPSPISPDALMSSTKRYFEHNQKVQSQINNALPSNSMSLFSGHKKDVVLTNHLYPNNPNHRVAIFGWMQQNGIPIQDLNPVSHDWNYADYSHGIRLIANDVMLNNVPKRLSDIFSDPLLCSLVSDEGTLKFLKY